jgi:hypothetical protein
LLCPAWAVAQSGSGRDTCCKTLSSEWIPVIASAVRVPNDRVG